MLIKLMPKLKKILNYYLILVLRMGQKRKQALRLNRSNRYPHLYVLRINLEEIVPVAVEEKPKAIP